MTGVVVADQKIEQFIARWQGLQGASARTTSFS
jgi:hypothetical protein